MMMTISKKSKPYTASELQQKIRSGELKVVSAATARIDANQSAVDVVLLAIGFFMDLRNPTRFAHTCYVTDESSVSDFFSTLDTPEQQDSCCATLTCLLNVPVTRQSRICEVAEALAVHCDQQAILAKQKQPF